MDNITHSLLGAALAKTRLGRAAPFAPAALVVAANLPDFENFVLVFGGRTTNLVNHRGLTHGVLGIAVLIPLFTLLVYRLGKRLRPIQPGTRAPRSRAVFRNLLIGIGLAVASHPALDWLNTYGVRPWLPFDATWYYGDVTFIVDPWLWLLLGAAVCLAGRRTRAGSLALGALAALLTAIVLIHAHMAPLVLQIVWPAAIAALALARLRNLGQAHPNAVVGAAFVLIAAYLGFLGWAGRKAWNMSEPVIAARLALGEVIRAHTTSPQPANPLRWEIIAQTQTAVYRHTFSITRRPGGVVRLARRLDDPLVRRAADSPQGRAWRAFARHPVAAVVKTARGRRVYLMDARYPLLPVPSFASFAIDLPDETTAKTP